MICTLITCSQKNLRSSLLAFKGSVHIKSHSVPSEEAVTQEALVTRRNEELTDKLTCLTENTATSVSTVKDQVGSVVWSGFWNTVYG